MGIAFVLFVLHLKGEVEARANQALIPPPPQQLIYDLSAYKCHTVMVTLTGTHEQKIG